MCARICKMGERCERYKFEWSEEKSKKICGGMEREGRAILIVYSRCLHDADDAMMVKMYI